MHRVNLQGPSRGMLSSIFLSEDIFEPAVDNPSPAENANSLLNKFFAKNFHVLRKEICLAAGDVVEGKPLRAENTEFIQALYDLQCDSRSSDAPAIFTPQILKWHLKRIRRDFKLYMDNTETNTRRRSSIIGDDEDLDKQDRTADINITGPVLLECVETLHKLLWLIINDEQKAIEAKEPIKDVSIQSLIASRLDWNEAYEEFQEAFLKACLEIKALITVNTLQRHGDYLRRVKQYLVAAKSYSRAWADQLRELKEDWAKINQVKHNKANSQVEGVLVLDTVFSSILDNAERNLEILNQLFEWPLLTRHWKDDQGKVIKTSQDIYTYHEFQMHFWLKAKFLFKGLELKKHQKVYEAEFSALAEAALKKAENASKSLKAKALDSTAEIHAEIVEDKAVPTKEIDPKSLEQHQMNMTKLQALNTEFQSHIATLKNAVIGLNAQEQEAANESKSSNDSTQGVNVSSQVETVRPKLFINTEEANEAVEREYNEYDAFYKNLDDFVKTPMAVNPRIPGHARRFSTFFSISEFRESVGCDEIDEELDDQEAESSQNKSPSSSFTI